MFCSSRKILFQALSFLCLVSCIFCENNLPNPFYGAYAVRMDTDEVLIDESSDLSMIPASCMKIVTTGAALHLLEERPFKTALEYDGLLKNKILYGNLYIKGGGDPTLGSGTISPDWQKIISLWADEVQKKGIGRIEGKVIGDATVWEKALVPSSWSWEDIGNYYGAGASGLSFHENYYTIFFAKGKKDQNAKILRVEPPLNDVLHNELKIGPAGSGDCACVYGCEFFSEKYLRGTIPEGEEFAIKGAITDPAVFVERLLKAELKKRKIAILDKEFKKTNRTAFHVINSPSLSEIVYLTNQKSINLYSEHLLKKIGEKIFNDGSTVSGLKAVYNFWKSQNIDLRGFNQFDGSGLSRKNLITAKQLVSILIKMKKSDYFLTFFESLPEVGDIRAKSGGMSMIKCYAGYRGNIAFAVLINHSSEKDIEDEMERFFSRLRKL